MKLARLCVLQIACCAAVDACQMVEGDRLHASDMAALVPAFGKLDPALEIGLSPLPGVKRVFHAADVLRLARANALEIAGMPSEICFERSAASIHSASPAAPIAPLAVHRGDKVSVTVSAGSVRLRFESEAESSGRPGDSVIVLNPENGNRFVGRVEDVGKVTVIK